MTDNNHKDTPISARIPQEVRESLDRLAETTKRSRNFHVAEALTEYVAENEWQIKRMTESLKRIKAGKGVPHEQVKAWARSLGTKRELPPPGHS